MYHYVDMMSNNIIRSTYGTIMRNLMTISLVILCQSACAPVMPYDCGCIESENPDQLADSLGPALAEVLQDGLFSCEDHQARNQYNICPEAPPELGTDDNGVTWTTDRVFFDLLPNPYHAPLDCYRGTSPELGLSSYQCCYDANELVSEGPLSGSFDFISPLNSILATIAHYIFDMVPPEQCPAI
jgi:hypothetical protein